MGKALELWERRYLSLQRTFDVGLKSLKTDAGYVYRVANIFFEAAFARYLVQPQSGWQDWMHQAFDLYSRSFTSNDCLERPDYPLNLARLCQEWYLCLWLLSNKNEDRLLLRSIDLFSESLWQDARAPLTAFAALPPLYMMRRDKLRLLEFWKTLEKRSKLDNLPDELDLYRRWTEVFPGPGQSGSDATSGFFVPYTSYCRKLKDPTQAPARFFLSAAYIGIQSFDLEGSLAEVLTQMAVVPW